MLKIIFLAFAFLSGAASAEASIARFQSVSDSIHRGGQPTEIADYWRLKELGVKVVMSLRTTPEQIEWERKTVEGLGMEYRSYPIDGMSYPSPETLAKVLRVLENADEKPVFIHCFAGKDRTGLSIGLHRVLHMGWAPKDAYAEMLRIGFDPNLRGLREFFWDHAE